MGLLRDDLLERSAPNLRESSRIWRVWGCAALQARSKQARNYPKIAAITAMQIGLVTVENSMPSRAKLKPTLYLAA